MIDEERLEGEETEPEPELELNRDKIFGNDYGSSDFDLSTTKFSIEDSHREKRLDEIIDETVAKDLVSSLILLHPRFHRMTLPVEDGEYLKVNKSEINEIYSYVVSNLPNKPKIEIFSTLTDLYDISPEKFYESLSNTFKTELIIELRNRGYLKRRNFLF
jgi:hypothetical protein